MAEENPEPEGQGAHGPALAGHGRHGLLNGQHKQMIIVVCSVIGVGLAYATLRKSASSGSSSAQTAAMGYPGSSATLSSGQVAGFDQAAVAGLQTMMANQSDMLRSIASGLPSNYGAGAAPATPSPIAAGLFAPTNSGNFALYGNGTVAEVESDGSQLGLNWSQWNALQGQGAKVTQTMGMPSAPAGTAYYQTNTNLTNIKAPAAAGS